MPFYYVVLEAQERFTSSNSYCSIDSSEWRKQRLWRSVRKQTAVNANKSNITPVQKLIAISIHY
jgi:hypothetical protein